MKIPLSWIKDFVDIHLPIETLAHTLTMAGLEVEEIRFVGLPLPKTNTGEADNRQETKISGLEWDAQAIVVGAIYEVMPHPNADRLVLCRLDDGKQIHTVLTGAPNLFPYKGIGELEKPIKVAYAKEGASIYDGHQAGQVLVTLKRAKIRGVDSYSMACSEKELGISDEHEGIIVLDDDAPVGMPLVEYMGDAVLDIAITPNIARNANVYGIAREIAALTGEKLRSPDLTPPMAGKPIRGRVGIQIQEPAMNPRFVLGLIEDINIKPSPYWVQRRLRLAGMRPINNVVDATNYAMLELGQPLHAFDFDVLLQRAGGNPPTIITRAAKAHETLKTLDDIERQMNDFTTLVCDTAGALSIAGVMGGAESEVNVSTRNVLLEGAAWNMINIRRTVLAQNLPSEASYRFSRGVHPAMAERGVQRGLQLLHAWSGGVVASGLVDNYPLPPVDPTVAVTPQDVERWLGITLTAQEIADLLRSLEFRVEIQGEQVLATTPDHRLDIGEGITGKADLIEEIARIYGYERIPETRMADSLPPQRSNPSLEEEERLRDLLVNLGLQEVITYRMSSPEREGRLQPVTSGEISITEQPYVRLRNPIVSDRTALRQSLLASVLDVVERNARLQQRMAIFEIGSVYLPQAGENLPQEPRRLALALTGARALPGWQASDQTPLDFYDLKGIISGLINGLHLENSQWDIVPHEDSRFHPGRCARLLVAGEQNAVFGEIHPLVRQQYELPPTPLLAAEFDLESLLAAIPDRYLVRAVPVFPPVLEDLAVVVDESVPATQVEQTIRQAADATVTDLRLFDVYRGEQIGIGKKSLAYSLTYQAEDRTLTDAEVAQIRKRIIQHLEKELSGKLRS